MPTRASRSPARCWPVERWTCWSSTCRCESGSVRIALRDVPPGVHSPIGSADWRRWPGGLASASSSWSRRTLPAPADSPARSARRPASGWSWPVGRGSGSAETWSASGRRSWSPATGPAHRAAGRPSGSSTQTVASATPASAATGSSTSLVQPSPPSSQCPRSGMRLLHLHRPHLLLDFARRRQPSGSWPAGPVILGGKPWSNGSVLDADPAARALGVRRGMPLGSAHRLAPEATFLDAEPEADRTELEAAFERLTAFSPAVAGTSEPADVAFGLLEAQVDGLAGLWGPEPVMVERIGAALEAPLAGAPRAGIAGTRFAATVAALAAAEPGSGEPGAVPPGAAPLVSVPLVSVPPGAEAEFLAPLPASLLTPDAEIRARLRRFGLRRIGQVADLAASALVARFGTEGERIGLRSRGIEVEPFRPRRAPERLLLGLPIEPAVAELEAIRFVLHRLAVALGESLAARGLAAERGRLRLVLDLAFARA